MVVVVIFAESFHDKNKLNKIHFRKRNCVKQRVVISQYVVVSRKIGIEVQKILGNEQAIIVTDGPTDSCCEEIAICFRECLLMGCRLSPILSTNRPAVSDGHQTTYNWLSR